MASAGPSSAPMGTATTTLFGLIHELHDTISKSVDTALSWEVLGSPPINYSLIRPLISRLSAHISFSPSSRRRKGGDSKLAVPSPRSRHGKHADSQLGLGRVIYALMANR